LKKRVLADFQRTGRFPAPSQLNVRIEPGLFSEALTRYLKDGWPPDLIESPRWPHSMDVLRRAN
jgi:hypothetical protein